MKKYIIAMLLMGMSISMFAQLKVKSDGRVVSGYEYLLPNTNRAALQSGIRSSATVNFGVYGYSDNIDNTSLSYGVYGYARNANPGFNFGVVGAKDYGVNGVGVFGTNSYTIGYGVNGSYAGFFVGDTKVVGTLTANSLIQSSDLRLKDNVVSLGKRGDNILDKVLNMNVVEYNYKPMIPSILLPDTVSIDDAIKLANINPGKKHIGLIAQELQELFPTLVEEGQDGYLGINYVELVPVLVCAIQELKAQVDALQGNAEQTFFKAPSTTNVSNRLATGNVLYQNSPNPFKEQTVIRFSLADNAQDANICIFDMTGKTLKKLPISSGMESVSIGGYELGEGMFLYSLIVNGKEIDTKKMIITK